MKHNENETFYTTDGLNCTHKMDSLKCISKLGRMKWIKYSIQDARNRKTKETVGKYRREMR